MSLRIRLNDDLIRDALTPASLPADVTAAVAADIRAGVRATRQDRPWWWPLRSVVGPFGPSREVQLAFVVAALVAAALLVIAVASRRAAPLGDQSMFHGGAARTGEVAGLGPVAQPRELGQAPLGGPLANAMPALAGDRLFVGDGRGMVAVFEADSLGPGWSLQLPKPATSPAYADGVLVLGAGDGVYGLDAATGARRWQLATEGPVLSAPAIVDGVAYVGLPDGSVAAVDIQSGREVWQTASVGGSIDRAPAAADGRVFVGGDGGRFVAIDTASGAIAWTQSLGPGQVSTPAVRDGVVYVASGLDHGEDPHLLYALDERDGHVRWTFKSPSGLALYVGAVGPDSVFVVSLDGGVYAVRDGRQLWRIEAGSPIGSVATLSHGTLYVSASQGAVLAIDVAAQATRWVAQVEGDPGPAIVDGGRLWVGTDLGRLFAFGP